jgi:hypothetical protein
MIIRSVARLLALGPLSALKKHSSGHLSDDELLEFVKADIRSAPMYPGNLDRATGEGASRARILKPIQFQLETLVPGVGVEPT